MSLKIEYLEKSPEDIEKEAVDNLVKHFNELAKEKGIKYKIVDKWSHPHLVQRVMLGIFENYSIQICYTDYDKQFTFTDEINEEVLEVVKPVLEEIPEKFLVKLVRDREDE